ncbi:hypothetical protein PHAVU_006G068900 [Phaseolus vulgaris]|uniref:Uncharacterized protein n=1 Tax=Phaseolus vulgaris TaxID=3885 RepID=V7BNZ1_PHAVU|nr:hypothetical protein PHAVU_006G068900g [Phaseolus vulgaris]ESW18770.1 hypothetical protein PHAVU_006G068900g [Phaseolus vulgaris]
MAFGTPSPLSFCFFFFFLLTFFTLCSSTARNPTFFSNEDEAWSMVGRSLKTVNLEDYGEPTANSGHDPWKGCNWGNHVGPEGRTGCN